MTDEQAMLAVKGGDLDKAAILYERYKKSLLNFFLYRQPSRDVARDLTQQVFLRVLRYRHTFREEAVFRTWVYEVARNVFHDHLKTVRLQTNEIPELLDTEEEPEDRHQQLHQALGQLPDSYRDVLLLSRFQNMSYEEIGQVLGLSVANVKVRAFRGLQKLRELYFQLNE
ncbi:RNA polymerase subunit sigma [Siphonobacter sp. BAB-5385]|uniref:RNA polymerase sigma factor n=1 Tax=Siphonobacter curvatus TaxID=2094562 RepID=A0A2S7IIB6_9BACT|nr:MULTISPECIES: RNA polymerase sigma factor [Siphonobacter]OZI07841.1 RNA polymerase subunit sigma [Siphonobacter sp. BAB-5385]PMD96151.1 RNA polymerase subunit sigma [Siphonobacter sp. BAB-5405]PQA56138.1 RNA polymerase sigma factor [Siphonobacter curvatus]